MIETGLTAADRARYLDGLAGSRRMELVVELLDRDEQPHASLTAPESRIVDGAVHVDATADVTRSLTLTILDPEGRLHLDPSSPSRTALFADQFVRVARRDYIDTLGRYVRCPMFWGPITRFERAGPLVTVEAQGKETLARAPAVIWQAATYRKGAIVVDTIRDILERIGERRFAIPTGTARLPRELSLSRHAEPWVEALRLARAVNRQLFYDALGRVRVRQYPRKPVYTFYARAHQPGEPRATVLGEPQITYDFAEVRNLVEVLGPEPQGRKPRLRYVATPARAHPLSPWSLARNGRPRYLVDRVENDKIARLSQARALGDRLLEERLRIALGVDFESLPIPVLEEHDLVAIRTATFTATFRLQRFTLPLTADGTMSVGSLKQQPLRRRPAR